MPLRPHPLPGPLSAAIALALALTLGPPAVAPVLAGPDPVCGPHEHVFVERDEEEGSTVKRCVCDEGYVSEGPGKPCKPIAGAAPGKGAPPAAGGGKRSGKGGEK